jgi:toxin ParE1/3/4
MRASRRCERGRVRRLEWKAQAENDLFDILDYIGRDNPDAAVELVQKIRTKVDGLRERPTLYRAGRIRGTREMIVHRNYIVFYRASDEAVTILRVKRARRQWP